jgi:hypothetical protein
MIRFPLTPSRRTHRTSIRAFVGACVLLATGCKLKPIASASVDGTQANDSAATAASQPSMADSSVSAAPVAATASVPRERSHRARGAQASAAAPAQTAVASSPAPAVAPAPPTPPLVATTGTAFSVLLSDTVTTAKAHQGDRVAATVATDVRDASGAIVIPAGSPVHGTVTTSSGPAHTPHLAVGFTSVDVRGHSYALQSTVMNLPVVKVRRTARVAQAGEVGGGAVAGGLIGRLIGGRKSGGTVIGAVAGAAAGVVVADKTQSNDAVLPKGARVVLQITSPVTIPRS